VVSPRDAAVAVSVVERYLERMVAHDWDGLAATLAPDVVRNGPYRDDFTSRDEYVAFLRSMFEWMQDYEMHVARIWGEEDGRVCAELSETVTLDGKRLRTDEAVVCDVDLVRDPPVITRVQVFLQQSYEPTTG
jgi:ketosteroid isomerase-like protein